MWCITEALLSIVLQLSPSHVQSKVNSYGKDEDREDHDADDHSHQRAVVLAFIQRTCVREEKDTLKKMTLLMWFNRWMEKLLISDITPRSSREPYR